MRTHKPEPLSRRNFLKLAALSMGGFSILSWDKALALTSFSDGTQLGRVNVGRVDLKERPDAASQTIGVLYEDAVVSWLQELVGKNIYRTNQRWVETPDGYIWSPYLQPVRNVPNKPVESLPENPSLGKGMWVEVSVPYVILTLDNPPARSPGFKKRLQLDQPIRLYYTQIVWVDQIKTDAKGTKLYRANEKYGTYGDILWGAAQAFRPIAHDEITPIHPEAEEKRIVVNLTYQTLSCFEGIREVYFARISSGAMFNSEGQSVDAWATPVGKFPIWRKLFSLHMSGGTTGGGWDLPGVGWTSLFVGSGIAIHSTFWHNNFGEPMSRGCVNATPEDSKWIFRWTLPAVSYDP